MVNFRGQCPNCGAFVELCCGQVECPVCLYVIIKPKQDPPICDCSKHNPDIGGNDADKAGCCQDQ